MIINAPVNNLDNFKIHIGYHSYASKKVARRIWYINKDQRIQEFIIPKGAYYVVNKNGEIVSSKIVMVKNAGINYIYTIILILIILSAVITIITNI